MLKSETPPQPPPKKNTSLLNFMTWFAPCRFWSLVFLFETKSLRWLSGWKIWKISHTSWLGLMLRCRCFFFWWENHHGLWKPLVSLKAAQKEHLVFWGGYVIRGGVGWPVMGFQGHKSHGDWLFFVEKTTSPETQKIVTPPTKGTLFVCWYPCKLTIG